MEIKIPEIVPLEYNGEKVFTNSQLGVMYGCRRTLITDLSRKNKEKFQSGEDYYFLAGEELRKFKAEVGKKFAGQIPLYARNIYLWTKSGVLKIAKFLTTDNAKLIYDNFGTEDSKTSGQGLTDGVQQSKFEALMELIRLTTDEDLRNKLIREAAKIILGKDL